MTGDSADTRRMNKIGIVGAGVMGQGIAQLAAVNGFGVALFDVQPKAVDAAISGIGQRLRRLVEKDRLTEADLGTSLAPRAKRR